MHLRFVFTFCSCCLLALLLCVKFIQASSQQQQQEQEQQQPQGTVTLVLLVRDKAHYLPFFLGYIDRLTYPKHLISLYIRLDHSHDASAQLIAKWLAAVRGHYRQVALQEEEANQNYDNESHLQWWPPARLLNIMRLRQEALQWSREQRVQYAFFVDVDVMLVNERTVEDLLQGLQQYNDATSNSSSSSSSTAQPALVIAPLLNCSDSSTFANFWGAQNDRGYYKRSEHYFDIRSRSILGQFPVPVVHTAFLVQLQHAKSDQLHFVPVTAPAELDDLVVFSQTLRDANITALVDNAVFYGYFPRSLDSQAGGLADVEQFQHMKMQVMLDVNEYFYTLQPSQYLQPDPQPEKSRLIFDEIFLINLPRRTDRLQRMQYCLNEIGLETTLYEAVDGRLLNTTWLQMQGIQQLSGYADPYHKRDLKMGEIGCFMSHYFIWQKMLELNYEKILILEDDIRFASGFRRHLWQKVQAANRYQPDWDLLYIGRKRMTLNETIVTGSGGVLVYPEYTYWTLGYALTRRGAMKLIDQMPLNRMVAVDEYLPIMFNRHPRAEWSQAFYPRNLIALSVEPLLLEPTHYSGEPHYISDTEDSVIIVDAVNA